MPARSVASLLQKNQRMPPLCGLRLRFRFLATVSEALQGFAVRLSSSAGVDTHSDPAPDISGRTQVLN
jgi:hypothetical protein